MGNRDNAIEFTEVKYTSRKEMSNELGISVPEEMWNRIENYRKAFYSVLPLRDVENRNLFLCLYPTFASKCTNVDAKLSRLVSDYNKLDEGTGCRDEIFVSLLKALAVKSGMSINEGRIRKLLASENPFDADEEKLLNYFYALLYIEERYVNKIDVDFLADLYSKVTGISELTYFYRNDNITDIDSIALVSRIYKSAPVEKIEMMMDALFTFIENDHLTALNKALTAFYYISYIKPFKDYNDEIAILIAKAILAHNVLGEQAVLVPFENLLNQKPEVLRKMNQDVINTADLTYFVSPSIFRLDHEIDDTLDIIREFSARTLHRDFYQADEPVKEETPAPAPKAEEVVSTLVEEEPAPAPVVEKEPEPVVEAPKEEKKPVETPKPVSEPKPAPVKEEVPEEAVPVQPQGLAVNFIPAKLDEKEAQRLEEHLLEMDYNLSKGEAKFYARHCTLGMYYTIEQYRKCVKCVYETARTSMEHLVKLGYYSKSSAGKKFVYTPVKRK